MRSIKYLPATFFFVSKQGKDALEKLDTTSVECSQLSTLVRDR